MNSDQLFFLLYDISSIRALNCLSYIFKADTESINIGGKRIDLGDIFMHCKVEDKARDIGPITFYGGPPNNIGCYSGTLLTVLADWILTTYARNHYNLIKQLEAAGLGLDLVQT
jgi:hypothetical protein